jgi:flagellar motor switch/type III secretory pathway protein FliN
MSVEFGPVHSLPDAELEAISLMDLTLRVWAEVGRTQMPAASVVGMAEGSIVDLDCEADEPADLYVNGRHFGTGRLILVDGEWALRVESLDEHDSAAEQAAGDIEHSSKTDQGDSAPSD